jgi:hypothetical protein
VRVNDEIVANIVTTLRTAARRAARQRGYAHARPTALVITGAAPGLPVIDRIRIVWFTDVDTLLQL